MVIPNPLWDWFILCRKLRLGEVVGPSRGRPASINRFWRQCPFPTHDTEPVIPLPMTLWNQGPWSIWQFFWKVEFHLLEDEKGVPTDFLKSEIGLPFPYHHGQKPNKVSARQLQRANSQGPYQHSKENYSENQEGRNPRASSQGINDRHSLSHFHESKHHHKCFQRSSAVSEVMLFGEWNKHYFGFALGRFFFFSLSVCFSLFSFSFCLSVLNSLPF